MDYVKKSSLFKGILYNGTNKADIDALLGNKWVTSKKVINYLECTIGDIDAHQQLLEIHEGQWLLYDPDKNEYTIVNQSGFDSGFEAPKK